MYIFLRVTYLSIKYLKYFLVVLYLRKEEVPSRGRGKLELSEEYFLSV